MPLASRLYALRHDPEHQAHERATKHRLQLHVLVRAIEAFHAPANASIKTNVARVPVYYWGTLAEVHPPYYAHPFVADIIGNSGNIRIADLGLGQDTFSAYGIYDASSGKLKRVVLLNLLTWKTTDGTTRPSRSVTLQVGSTYTGTARVDKLTAPGADIQDPSKVSSDSRYTAFAYADVGR